MNNAKLQLEVASPTSIRCGHIEWFALDTKLVGKVKALLEKNKILKEKFKEIERLIDEDYFEDGSFNNEYYIREIINEVLEGEDNEKQN